MQNARQVPRSGHRRYPSLNAIGNAQSPTLPVLGIAHGSDRRIDRQMRHGHCDQAPNVLGNVSLIDAIRKRGNVL